MEKFWDILRHFCEKGIVLDDDAEYGLAGLAVHENSPTMFRALLDKDYRSAMEICYEAVDDAERALKELRQLALYEGSSETDSDRYMFFLSRDYRKP